jgi:hypothetical protein
LPTPNENDILSQKAEQTIQFCWPDNSWNINARILLANSKPLSFSTLIFSPAQERLD